MKREILCTISALPYRQPIPVYGFRFGSGDKTLAVMGAIRGDEFQQMYTAARLIQRLEKLESDGALSAGILVVPCMAQFSMNVSRRFWPLDNTDINRMFPGYADGETTQRLAHRIFQALQGYQWGIHLTSFYLSGDFVPHLRIMETGFQKDDAGLDFGLPYLVIRSPHPYDTVTLNYNWQIWGTNTFSLYTRAARDIEPESAEAAVESILRFLHRYGLSSQEVPEGCKTVCVNESQMAAIRSSSAGILLPQKRPGDKVTAGEMVASILDPYTAKPCEEIQSPVDGTIFFFRHAQIRSECTIVCRIIPQNNS
ncbi:MAG: succinylglutamate desuccinylase/aspartoacylase family protein [Selenomonadaceae bacterium]|nr:succinylglutamate desuccinylase/aspartoacylase family protein [Selenomonadaceae bacterium]